MIVVHIGLRKAASATLQAFLAANDEVLLSRGVEYPRVGRAAGVVRNSHANLALELRGVPRFDPAFGTLAQLEAHWRSSPARTLILSSEMFEDASASDAARLGRILRRGDEEVRVVLILRPLAAVMASSYGQKVKFGVHTYDFDTFFEGRMGESRVDYFKTARRWAEAFGWGSMRLRLLDPGALTGGDLIDDFLEVAGLSAEGLARPGDLNITPGWRVLEAVRGLYAGRHGLPGDHLFADAAGHTSAQKRMFGTLAMTVGGRIGWNADRGRYLSARQAARCAELFESAVHRLNRRLPAPLPVRPSATAFVDRAFLPDVSHIAATDLRRFYDAVAAEPAPGPAAR